MSQKTLNSNDIINYVSQLPFADFNKLVRQYANRQRADVTDTMNFVVVSNFEERLAKLGVNSSCPQCPSTSISKYGKRNNIQVFKCKDCSIRFTRFSGTVLEKTRWHWDIWLKVLEMTLKGYSIEDIRNVLINDYACVGIDIKTVWLWRLKLITAMANMPMPVLSGVVQVDETFVRESQKGSRNLKSMVSQNDVRKPRYGRQSSKYGVMGSEFATVVTAVDNRGYCVCKFASLGKLSTDIFYDLFHVHLDSPAFLL